MCEIELHLSEIVLIDSQGWELAQKLINLTSHPDVHGILPTPTFIS